MGRACIGIGSNLGDRAAHLEAARAGLCALPGTRLLAFSHAIETDPIGPPGQGRYLNAAAVIETALEPAELLDALRDIERSAGRVRHTRWSPRTLDLDVLLYDDRVVNTASLTIPHPGMHERRFVLEPLAGIAPDALHPRLGRTVAQLLESLDAGG